MMRVQERSKKIVVACVMVLVSSSTLFAQEDYLSRVASSRQGATTLSENEMKQQLRLKQAANTHLHTQSGTARFQTGASRYQPGPTRQPAYNPVAFNPTAMNQVGLNSHARRVIAFYGGNQSALQVLNQPNLMPSRMIPNKNFSNHFRNSQLVAKPFSGYRAGPTISPYLALDRDERDSVLPNYYAYVRPALRQQETSSQNQSALRKLNRRVNTAQTILKTIGTAGTPAAGYQSYFGNTGQYYAR